MYYDHFGLTRAPFKITPNTEFFFTGGNRGPVLEALMYAITHGEGIVKVSGEVGSGKTMLCNMLQERLPEYVESVYLANPSVAPEDVLHAIAFELQLGVDRGADRLEVMHVLQDYLVKRYAEGKRVVVFIEESQSMPLATLEEIRLLSNLETRNDKLLQIILFGQPELDAILQRPDTRQLRDRIAHSFSLEPLTQQQVREYLTFRMRAAGYRGPEVFSASLVKQIAKASSGLTRRVNLIADKALLAAFSENTHTVTAKHIEAALRDTEFGKPRRRFQMPLRYAWLGLAVVVGTVLGASLYAFADGRLKNTAPSTAAAQVTTPAAPVQTVRAPAVASIPEVGSAPATGARLNAHAAPAVAVAFGTSSPTQAMVTPASMQTSAPATMTDAPLNEMNGDMIANRIEATRRWIQSDPKENYSIQLLVTSNEEQLRNDLNALAKFIEINDIYMYRTGSQGRSSLYVLWRSFNSRQTALQQLAELPPSLRSNRPFLRTIEDVRADMDRYSAIR